MANITPKDPVTLGLTTQRELDAAVAKAAKAAGVPPPADTRFEGDREALIEELRSEREQHVARRRGGAGGRRRRSAARRDRARHPRPVHQPSERIAVRLI